MSYRIIQSTKAMSVAVVFALLWQPGVLGCVLGCASAAPVVSQKECHRSTPSPPSSTTEISAASSAEHNCCHIPPGGRRDSEGSVNPFHRVAAMMPCCLNGDEIVIPAVRQSATTEESSAIAAERLTTPVDLEFRDAPVVGHTWLPDRGGIYLRCHSLLI